MHHKYFITLFIMNTHKMVVHGFQNEPTSIGSLTVLYKRLIYFRMLHLAASFFMNRLIDSSSPFFMVGFLYTREGGFRIRLKAVVRFTPSMAADDMVMVLRSKPGQPWKLFCLLLETLFMLVVLVCNSLAANYVYRYSRCRFQ